MEKKAFKRFHEIFERIVVINMVLRNIERLKDIFPDLLHVAMFYDNGTVFKTTFEQPLNIPQIGANLTQTLKHIETLIELGKFESSEYTKLIYEAKNLVIIILKLGEQSNLALFFRKGESEPEMAAIKKYLHDIEKLIDTDKVELDKQELGTLKKEINEFERELKVKLESLELNKLEMSKLDEKMKKYEEELALKQSRAGLEDSAHKKEAEKMIMDMKNEVEIEKERVLHEINRLFEDIKKIKTKISEKDSLISELEGKIKKSAES